MSEGGRFLLTKSRSERNFGFMSPQASSRNYSRNNIIQSPRMGSLESSSIASNKHLRTLGNESLKINKIPVQEMFRRTTNFHSGTILPEHLYHPPKSSACLLRSPCHKFPITENKSFINLVEEHSRRIPSPSDYNKNLTWLNKTARDLSKGSMRKTIIDQIYIEKKKIPSPSDYKNMPSYRITGSALNKARGFSFMSETEYLGKMNPSPSNYEIKEHLVRKRSPGWKITIPKDKAKKLDWKTVKLAGAAVGSYNNCGKFNFFIYRNKRLNLTQKSQSSYR